jgi:hypothetical protein
VDKLKKYLKKIDGKKVSFEKAFKIMEKIIEIRDKEKTKQIEMELKFE